MKSQILNHTGLTEEEFYKKYKDSNAFFNSKVGKAFKAKYGATLSKAQDGSFIMDTVNNLPSFAPQTDMPPGVDTSLGTTAGGANRFNLNKFGQPNQGVPQNIGYTQGNPFAKQTPFDPNQASKAQMAKMPSVGNQLPEDIGYKAAVAGNKATTDTDTGQAIKTGIGMVDSVIGGFGALKAEKAALKSARTWKDVSNISRQASETEDVNKRGDVADTASRTRKALMPTVNTEEFMPSSGVGTNVLARGGGKLPTGGLDRGTDYGSKGHPYPSVSKGDFAGGGRSYPIPTVQDAGDALRLAGLHHRPDVKAKVYAKYPELRHAQDGINNFAPGDIYDDLEDEPLEVTELDANAIYTPDEEEITKAYKSGGAITKAFFGSLMGALGGGGASGGGGGMMGGMANAAGSIGSNIMGNNAGTQIGGGFGEAAGSMFGPIGGMVGKAVGSIAGGLLDKNPQKTAKAQKEMMGNVNVMSGMNSVKDFRSGHAGVFKDGGYMSWEYPNPQVITHFGENSMHDLLRPDPMMDTLRSGGNLRSNQVGGLEAVSGGHLEPMSYNPYLSGSGITSMIKGQSHEQSNGRHTGVILDYMGNKVEAENGEPVVQRQDGGSVGEEKAEISGNQTFNSLGGTIIPELKEFVGQKVKKIHEKLAREDAKLNKQQAKNTKELNEFDPKTQIDKLSFNALSMNEKGADIRYKNNARKLENLLSYQDAVNRTSKSLGVDAGELTRGDIKNVNQEEVAKDGTQLPKAQFGLGIGDAIMKSLNRPVGEGGKTAEGYEYKNGRWQKTAKAKATEARAKAVAAAKPKATVKEEPGFLSQVGDWAKKKLNQPVLAGGQADPNYEYKKGKWVNTAMQREQAKNKVTEVPAGTKAATAPVTPVTPGKTPKQTVTSSAPASNFTKPITNTSNQAAAKPAQQAAQKAAVDDYVSEFGLEAWKGNVSPGNKYGKKTASSFATKEWDDIARNMGFTGKGNKEFQVFLMNNPESRKLILDRHKELYGRTPESDEKLFDDKLGYGWAADALKGLKKKTLTTDPTTTMATDKNYDVTKYEDTGWETLAAQALPWFRKQPGEGLRGDQLAGEMYSMATNKEEPVQARFYHPQLDVPYDISYQDQLNENQADFNQLQRAAGSNPEALAALAGQKYMANSKVLAEQFRANQGMKDKVYSGNRATLNDAMLKNLAIADQQYERQAQAKSNTKEIYKGALDSIAAKIGQNRLENRQLQVGANEFGDFSYDANMRLRKTGAPTTFNIPQQYGPTGAPITSVPVRDAKGNTIGYQAVDDAADEEAKKAAEAKKAKAASRNGNIVKAFRNL